MIFFILLVILNLREISEQQEDRDLAPYAVHVRSSKGRNYPEERHPLRTDFQRDRDRVLYSKAFRRLEYKTQVFPNHEGDHFRTRLTHTFEVANLSRTMAKGLKLNEDFSECLALVHDIGHPPFGHCGETVLAKLMEPHGGFEHNEQTYRLVTVLEKSYTQYPGLNLTVEILEAILQHTKQFRQRYPNSKQALLETQLVSITDEIAYIAHDIEDGLVSKILNENEVGELTIINHIFKSKGFPKENDPSLRRKYLVRQILNSMVLDFLEVSQASLKKLNLKSTEDVRKLENSPLGFSKKLQSQKSELESFLKEKMYHHPKVMKMMNKSSYFMEKMFLHFQKFPMELPLSFQNRFESDGMEKSIVDYLAGMTDRFLQDEYIRLFMPFQKML